ncbi:hypothetical protein ACFL2V_21810, partial [Pseudomonadota bacterium]
IAQLLLQNHFDEWRSTDQALLRGGEITYEALLEDPRLEGKKIQLEDDDPDTGDPRYRYILTKKQ